MPEELIPENVKRFRKKVTKTLIAYTVGWALTMGIGMNKFYPTVGGGNRDMDIYHKVFYASQALKHSPEDKNELYKTAQSIPSFGREFLDDFAGDRKDKIKIGELSDILEAEKQRLEQTPLVKKYLVWNSAALAVVFGGLAGGFGIVLYGILRENKLRREWRDSINN